MKSLYDISLLISESAKSLSKLPGNELEIKILSPLTYHIGLMAARIMETRPEAIEINNFIEVVQFVEKTDKGVIKIRSRTPYQLIKTMHMTPQVLLRSIKDSTYERKTTLQENILIPDKIHMTISSEVPIVYTAKSSQESRVYFVSQILCRVGNWIIDYKMKHQLGLDESQLCSFILSGYRSPQVSVEIEFNGKPSTLNDSHLEELHTLVFNQLFMTHLPLDRLYLDIIKDLFAPIKNIKMDTLIMRQSDMLSDAATLSEHITQKVNGSGVFFKIMNKKLYITTPESDLWKVYDTSIETVIYGRGEMVDDIVYPFFIYNETLEASSRLSHIDSFFQIYQSNSINELRFVKKDFIGPFSSLEARCAAIISLLKSATFPIDGIVFLNGNQILDIASTHITDYKFKDDNTIDLLGVVVMNDIAFVGAPGINGKSQTRDIHLNLYSKEGSNVTRLGKTQISKNDSLFKYVVETKYFISTFHHKPILHFHKMIIECSIGNEDDVMVVREIRPAKTDKYITHRSLGNPTSMIKNLEHIQQGTVSMSTLETLAFSFNLELLKRSPSIIVSTKEQKIVKVINQDISFLPVVQHTAIYIISQFAKTNLIYTACSPMFSSLYPPHDLVKTVLMIDGGAGDDIRKYNSNGTSYYLLTDPSKEQIEKAEKLFRLTEKRISQTQKGNIGSYNVRTISILSEGFVSLTKKLMPKVNVIDWQLSMQYSWSAETKERIINTLFQISQYGTKLLISCMNGVKLREALSTSKTLSFKQSVDGILRLNYIDNSIYQYCVDDKSVNEFYVDLDEVIADLRTVGFILVSRNTFSSLMEHTENFFDFLHTLDTQESTKKFFTQVKSTKMYPMIYTDALRYHSFTEYMFFIRTAK